VSDATLPVALRRRAGRGRSFFATRPPAVAEPGLQSAFGHPLNPSVLKGVPHVSDRRYDSPIVHIHGQRYPHDAVEIFGTTPGLERLINTLIESVHTGRSQCEILVSDGCEAEVRVACLDGRRRDEEWRRSGSPYLDLDDPLVSRIIELTDEVERLRQALQRLNGSLPAGIAPPA
jgi:hypothetical protein